MNHFFIGLHHRLIDVIRFGLKLLALAPEACDLTEQMFSKSMGILIYFDKERGRIGHRLHRLPAWLAGSADALNVAEPVNQA